MERLVSLFVLASLALATPALASSTRSFTIGGEAFGEGDIADARAQPDLGGRASVLIAFEPVAASRVAAISRANLNQKVQIILDGKLLAEAAIMEQLGGDSVQITGDFPIAEADRIARLISGKEPMPDSLEGDEP